jgi:hypothetical protein
MYYRRVKFCIIYLALNRGCFEAVLMKNTPRTLGVKELQKKLERKIVKYGYVEGCLKWPVTQI